MRAETIRNWTWVDTIVAMIRLTWFLVHLLALLTDDTMHLPSYMIWLLTAAYLGPHLFWRPGRVDVQNYPVMEMLCTGGLSVYCTLGLHEPNFLMLVPSMVIGYLYHSKTFWWQAAVIALFAPMLQPLIGIMTWGDYLLMVFNFVLLFGLGLSLNRVMNGFRRTQQLLEENKMQYELIQRQNKSLVNYAGKVEQMTLQEERSRMARELNDTIGHTYTTVAVGLDAVICLIDSSPEQAKNKLDVLRGVTRNGLEEVRRNIHQMAPNSDDVLLSQHLVQIAHAFSVHTATRVEVKSQGEERDLPTQVKLTLIRCLQESLTHAKRHGQATRVEVQLVFEPQQIRLDVRDDGTHADDASLGFGIRAVQERLDVLRGRLVTGTTEGDGLVVTCTVPV
jgi:signal transduction histidine kinase